MVKVSVIVPVYNVEKYLRKCLDSLVNQTLEDIEIIAVDDGSTDSSIDIIKEYAEKHSNIKYYQKENGGLSDARNFGLKMATGKYIAFLDSDDYVDKDIYKKMYDKAKKEDSDIVECNFYWAYDKKNKEDIGQKYRGTSEIIEKARVIAWNKLYKKEILDRAKVEFPKGLRYEDVEFFYKLVPYIEKVSFIKEPLIYYVQRKASLINTQNKSTRDIFIVLDNVINYYKQNHIYEQYREVLEFTYVRLLLCSSLKRICKIKDKNTRKKLLNETWIKINENFPNWKQNKILNTKLNLKKLYLISVNRFTYRIYTKICRVF